MLPSTQFEQPRSYHSRAGPFAREIAQGTRGGACFRTATQRIVLAPQAPGYTVGNPRDARHEKLRRVCARRMVDTYIK